MAGSLAAFQVIVPLMRRGKRVAMPGTGTAPRGEFSRESRVFSNSLEKANERRTLEIRPRRFRHCRG